jgi:hypothetical protein
MEQFFDYLLSRYHKSYTIFSMHLMSNPKKISSYFFFLIFIAYVIVSLPFKIKHTLSYFLEAKKLTKFDITKLDVNHCYYDLKDKISENETDYKLLILPNKKVFAFYINVIHVNTIKLEASFSLDNVKNQSNFILTDINSMEFKKVKIQDVIDSLKNYVIPDLIKKEFDLCLIEIEKESLNKSLNSHLIANENTNIKKIKTIKI